MGLKIEGSGKYTFISCFITNCSRLSDSGNIQQIYSQLNDLVSVYSGGIS